AIIVGDPWLVVRRPGNGRGAGRSICNPLERTRRQIYRSNLRSAGKTRGVGNGELISPNLLIHVGGNCATRISSVKARWSYGRVRAKDNRIPVLSGHRH